MSGRSLPSSAGSSKRRSSSTGWTARLCRRRLPRAFTKSSFPGRFRLRRGRGLGGRRGRLGGGALALLRFLLLLLRELSQAFGECVVRFRHQYLGGFGVVRR